MSEMMRVSGRGTDGLSKAIQTDNSGFLLTKSALNPTDRVVQEVVIFDALEIRDTAYREKSENLAAYKSVTYIVKNTLDVDVKIYIRTAWGDYIKVWDGTKFVELMVTLDSTTKNYSIILNSVLPELFNNYLSLAFRVVCSSAPSTGSITMKAYGELK